MAGHTQETEALAQPLSGKWYSGADITAVENSIKTTLVKYGYAAPVNTRVRKLMRLTKCDSTYQC